MLEASIIALVAIISAVCYCVPKMRRAHDEFHMIVYRDIARGGKDE